MTYTLRLLSFDKEASVYPIYCPKLDIWSQGRTVEEALAAIEEAIKMHEDHARSKEGM